MRFLIVGVTAVCLCLGSSRAVAADPYPRSEELVAAQNELDGLRASGPEGLSGALHQKRLDDAVSGRNAALAKRNEAWRRSDVASMHRVQDATCKTLRQRISEGMKATDDLEELQYAGFSLNDALAVVTQIEQRTPPIGKNLEVAYCILGLPADTVRSEQQGREILLLSYSQMTVRAENGIVTAWSPEPVADAQRLLPPGFSCPLAAYPSAALRANAQGTVVMKVVVGESNVIQSVEVLKSAGETKEHKALDAASVRSARSCKYAGGVRVEPGAYLLRTDWTFR